jgi:uncharacterized protein YjiS (DUF1127 family)
MDGTIHSEAAGTRTVAGTCFCGAVAIEATGEPEEMGYCHCCSSPHLSEDTMTIAVIDSASPRSSRFARFVCRVLTAGERARIRADLGRLDERNLRDIGVSRARVDEEIRRLRSGLEIVPPR